MVGLCLLSALPAQSQGMKADVEAEAHDNYARLIVSFRDRTLLPEFSSRIANGILQIDFAEPVEADVASVPTALSKYVSVALADPAGFGLRFGLKAKYRINTMEAGEKLFIDLLPKNWQGEPPPLPDEVIKELARRAEAALKKVRDLEKQRFGKVKRPKVSLRVGRHPTFTRLSFFWNVPFDTNFQREGDLVRLVFSRDSDLNLYDVLADKPPGLLDFDTFEEDKKLKVILQVADNVDVRAFREEGAYVVDIAPQNTRPDDQANVQVREALAESGAGGRTNQVSAPAPTPQQQTPVDPAVTISAPQGTSDPAPSPVPEPPTSPLAEVPSPAREAAATASDIDATRAQPVQPSPPVISAPPAPRAPVVASEPAEQTVSASSAAAPRPAATPNNPASRIRDASNGLVPVPEGYESIRPDPRIAPINTGVAPINPATDPLASSEPRRVAIGGDGRVLDPQNVPRVADQTIEGIGEENLIVAPNRIEVEGSRVGDMVRLVFPFDEPTPAAVFKRSDSLWLVFQSKDKDLGLDSLRSALKDIAKNIVPTRLDGAQAIRIDLMDPVLATVATDGNNWIISIGDLILEPSQPVNFDRSVRADGGMILAAQFLDAQGIITLTDPRAGDTLVVVTGLGPARGVIKPQRFVEVDALPSAHGIALVTRSDEISVQADRDRVLIEQPSGLSLSTQNLAAGTALLPVKVAVTRPGFVDFGEMYEPHPPNFWRRKALLQDAIARAGEGSKAAEWLALARFFLANRFAQEAHGVLTLVRDLDPQIENDSAFLLMMGAAETLAGRPKAAERYLQKHELKDSPDADVWKVIHFSGDRRWPEASRYFNKAKKAVGNYPPNLQALFSIGAAEAAVELNDFGKANSILSEIDPGDYRAIACLPL